MLDFVLKTFCIENVLYSAATFLKILGVSQSIMCINIHINAHINIHINVNDIVLIAIDRIYCMVAL